MSGGVRLIPDGVHSVQVAAVDAAANETRSDARSIVVDDDAPAAPAALETSVGSAWQASPAFTATWTNPTGQLALIDTAHWVLCPQGSTAGCLVGSQPVSGRTGAIGDLRVPSEGAWELAVRLEDAAGNTTSASTGRTTVRYDATAPAAPNDLTIAPRAQSDLAFVGSWAWPVDAYAQLTRVFWTLCPTGLAIGCKSESQPVHGARGQIETSFSGEGDWTLDVRLQDLAGNTSAPMSVSLRYARLFVPEAAPSPPVATASALPSPAHAPTPAPSRAAARLRLSSAVLVRARRTLIVAGSTARDATGRVRLTAEIHRRGRSRKLTATATIHRGFFRSSRRLSRADAAARVTISARYAGSTRHKPAAARGRVIVRSH